MDDVSKITDLVPEFGSKIDQLKLTLLEETGYEWLVVQGRRTIAEQNALYAQGRTGPGNIVTKARGGQSAHNFGLAADMVPIKDGALWWGAPDSLFKQYATIARSMGLEAGYFWDIGTTHWNDPDHVEDTSWHEAQAQWINGTLKLA